MSITSEKEKIDRRCLSVKEMNLDGAIAMAHLQSGNPGTNASMEFAIFVIFA